MSVQKELFKINPQSKLPLYDQIERNLRELILNGLLEEGESVPSEFELASLYGVSRLTVRRALDELVRQSWLARRQGVGTFVTRPAVAAIRPEKLSFTEQMLAIGRQPGSQAISTRVVPASAKIAKFLQIAVGEPVVEIVRVRLADNIPLLLENSYLSMSRFPGLDRFPDPDGESSLVGGSLYAHLKSHYNVAVSTMDQTLKPVLLTETEASCLGAPAGSPAILSEIVALSSDGEPVEYNWSVSSGDTSEFYFHFRRGEEKADAGGQAGGYSNGPAAGIIKRDE